jgi:hypothetical protein
MHWESLIFPTRKGFLAQLLRESESASEIRLVAGQVSSALATTAEADNALTYSQLYCTPWASNEQRERRHEALSKRLQSWTPRIQSGTCDASRDENAFVLLCHVFLFSTEFLVLQRPAEAEAVQLGYMHRYDRHMQYCSRAHRKSRLWWFLFCRMYRYLRFRYPERALSKFVDGMLLVSYAREAQEIRRKRLPVWRTLPGIIWR